MEARTPQTQLARVPDPMGGDEVLGSKPGSGNSSTTTDDDKAACTMVAYSPPTDAGTDAGMDMDAAKSSWTGTAWWALGKLGVHSSRLQQLLYLVRLLRQWWVVLFTGMGALVVAQTVLPGAWGRFAALLQHNVVVQSMFGTSIAAAVMGVVQHATHRGLWWGLSSLGSTLQIQPDDRNPKGVMDGTMHDIMQQFMVRTPSVQMPLATASFANGNSLSGVQSFAFMVRRLATRGPGAAASTGVVTYTTAPTDLPVTTTFRGVRVVLRRSADNVITLWCPKRGRLDLLKDFVQSVVDSHREAKRAAAAQAVASYLGGACTTLDHEQRGPAVFRVNFDPSGGKAWWEFVKELRPRQASSMFLPPGVMDMLLKDVETFFGSADKYLRDQQAFRRGMCFSGPPGVGKSSIAAVLCTETKRDLCVLCAGAPELTDQLLDDLLRSAPEGALIVVEDVDAAMVNVGPRGQSGVEGQAPPAAGRGARGGGGGGLSRMAAPMVGYYPGMQMQMGAMPYLDEGDAIVKPVDDRFFTRGTAGPTSSGPQQQQRQQQQTLTLAGLLNALDSPSAHEGHIVILTTNHVEKLDPALLRAGRCDVRVELPLAGREQVTNMFTAFFPEASPQEVAQFVAQVRGGRFSPATLLGHLNVVRGDLPRALDASQLPASDRLHHRTQLVRKDAPRTTLFEDLWSKGLESVFPWALGANATDGASWANGGTTAYGSQSFLMAWWEDLSEGVHAPSVFLDKEEVEGLFLDAFPGYAEQAMAFARAVDQWCEALGRRMGQDRVHTHLYMNQDSAAMAVETVDQWLLTYNREGANVLTPWSLDFVLYFYGTSLPSAVPVPPSASACPTSRPRAPMLHGYGFSSPAVVEDIMSLGTGEASLPAADAVTKSPFDSLRDLIIAAGLTNGLSLLRAVCNTGRTEDDAQKNSAAIVAHLRMQYCAPVVRKDCVAMNRTDLAKAFCNSFEHQGVTFGKAMEAARKLTAPSGRSGYSGKVLAHYLTSCTDLEACVKAMLADQDTFDFPAMFRSSSSSSA